VQINCKYLKIWVILRRLLMMMIMSVGWD
jgi:hypothetical protein